MKNIISIIIETPKGSTLKYDLDKKSGRYKVGKFLPLGMSFPYDFGYVPDTLGEDGDPLDVIIISEYGTFPGCLMDVRIIGCMAAKQSKKAGDKTMIKNDRYIAVPELSLTFKSITDIKELSDEIYRELKDFFCNYNRIAGKEFKETDKLGSKDAMKKIIKNKDQ